MRISYRFNEDETAPRYNKSDGTTKGRIHFLPYHGENNLDKYAVAAKMLKVKEGKEAPKPLGRYDKRYYIVVKDPENGTYYRVNKLSLQKRLGISSEDIKKLSKSEIKLEEAIRNKIQEPLTKLNMRIADGKIMPLDKKEIEEIVQNTPTEYIGCLLDELIESSSAFNNENLYAVLDTVEKTLPRSTFYTFPEDIEENLSKWREEQYRKKVIDGINRYQIPKTTPISKEHKLSSELQQNGYNNFKQFINKVKSLPNQEKNAAKETIEEIASLGFKAFRGSLPSAFHNYSKTERKEANVLMDEFISAFDALPMEGTLRSECISQVCDDVGRMIQQRIIYTDQEALDAVENKIIRPIVESLEELLFKGIEKDSIHEVMQQLIHQSTVKNQVVKQVIEGCLFCKHAESWNDKEFEYNILSIRPEWVGIALKFLPKEAYQKGLQALGYDEYQNKTLWKKANKENRTQEFYEVRLRSVYRAMSPEDKKKYFSKR